MVRFVVLLFVATILICHLQRIQQRQRLRCIGLTSTSVSSSIKEIIVVIITK